MQQYLIALGVRWNFRSATYFPAWAPGSTSVLASFGSCSNPSTAKWPPYAEPNTQTPAPSEQDGQHLNGPGAPKLTITDELKVSCFSRQGYPLKIRLWQTLVLTKGLYAVEIRVLGRADLLYLEKWQIKKLRHLARSPVHITRETTEALRRRVRIPTIESQQRVRRLKWWRQLLAPRFAAATRNRIEQGHAWDASPAIRMALLGTFSFETNPLLSPSQDHGAPTPTTR